jgi:archaellum component FlaD/FlaE
MAIDPRTYDIDELRAASGAPVTDAAVGDGAASDWPQSGAGDDGDTDADSDSGSDDQQTADEASGELAALGDVGGRPAAAAAFESSVARDLAAMDRRVDGLERPYLPALPASLAAEALLFEWLEFLVLQAGCESVADALSQYERIGWLGADASEALSTYLSGLSDAQANVENGLDVDDHRISLHYVARLSAFAER